MSGIGNEEPQPKLELLLERVALDAQEDPAEEPSFVAGMSALGGCGEPPLKKARVARRRYCFSEGFRDRLSEILERVNDKAEAEDLLERSHEVVKVDCSRLSPEEMTLFEKLAFEVYYTDKSVFKLMFENNCARFYGAFPSTHSAAGPA